MMRVFAGVAALLAAAVVSAGAIASRWSFPGSHSASQGLPAGRDRSRRGNDVLCRVGRQRCDLSRQPPHRGGRNPCSGRNRKGGHRHRAGQAEQIVGGGRRNGQGVGLQHAGPEPLSARTRCPLRTRLSTTSGWSTRTAAVFTDSRKAVLYKVRIGAGGSIGSSVQTLTLSGAFALANGFNLNGIDATPNGKTLHLGSVQHREALPDRSGHRCDSPD